MEHGDMLHDVWLGLGSNLGDRRTNMLGGVRYLLDRGMELIKCSGIYETEPVGYTDQPDFYNMVVHVRSALSPLELLEACQKAEKKMKRESTFRWGPRTLDVDILYIDDLVVDLPELIVPHPRIGERAFVLGPLAEIDPGILQSRGLTQSASDLRSGSGYEGIRLIEPAQAIVADILGSSPGACSALP